MKDDCACCGPHEILHAILEVRNEMRLLREVIKSVLVDTKVTNDGGRTWHDSGLALMTTHRKHIE